MVLPFSDRGAPGTQRTTERRQARHFRVPHIGMEDTIYAEEIATIRESAGNRADAGAERLGRSLVGPTGLRRTSDTLTNITSWPHPGPAAGQQWKVLFNWFNEFDIVQPSEVVFNFANLQSEYVPPASPRCGRYATRSSAT